MKRMKGLKGMASLSKGTKYGGLWFHDTKKGESTKESPKALAEKSVKRARQALASAERRLALIIQTMRIQTPTVATIPTGIIPPKGYTDAVIVSTIAPIVPTTPPTQREMTRREQMATYCSDVYKERTPEERAALRRAYDDSMVLKAARDEARRNATEWMRGGVLSFTYAHEFAESMGMETEVNKV